MGREFRIISALQGSPVPVAPAIGLEEEGEDPFYVMGWVEGPILRSLDDIAAFPEADERRAIGERVVDTLVAIHDVDPDAVGLGDLAKKEDYVARQLHRWQGQFAKQHTRELPVIDEVHDRLVARIPEQGPATIVHGDYRLDNMILTPSGEVAAVVDWELCTLGDPLADVGLLLVYWGEEGDEFVPLLRPATMAPGFLNREQVKERYAERSGRDLSQIDFYVALGLWKLAIILEGVYARYAAGQYGAEAAEGAKEFGRTVERLAEAAAEAEGRLALGRGFPAPSPRASPATSSFSSRSAASRSGTGSASRTFRPSFADLRSVTSAWECDRAGTPVLPVNPCDPYGDRPANYPRLWLAPSGIGLGEGSTVALGVASAALFFVALLYVLARGRARGPLLCAAIAISPGVMFAVERGNVDLLLFALLALALALFRGSAASRAASHALFLLAAMLKLFPVFAWGVLAAPAATGGDRVMPRPRLGVRGVRGRDRGHHPRDRPRRPPGGRPLVRGRRALRQPRRRRCGHVDRARPRGRRDRFARPGSPGRGGCRRRVRRRRVRRRRGHLRRQLRPLAQLRLPDDLPAAGAPPADDLGR